MYPIQARFGIGADDINRDMDNTSNAILALCSFIKSKWTERQRYIIAAMIIR